MRPQLWGPGMWHMLLVSAWHGKDETALSTMIQVLVPVLLPCAKCRQNYHRHTASLRKHRLFATENEGASLWLTLTSRQWFVWVYLLKRAVNKTTREKDTPFQDVASRFYLHSGRVDDVLVADTLLMLALEWEGHRREEDDILALCQALSKLLPLPSDSVLGANLVNASRPLRGFAYSTYKNTRVQNGLRYLSLPAFARVAAEEDES